MKWHTTKILLFALMLLLFISVVNADQTTAAKEQIALLANAVVVDTSLGTVIPREIDNVSTIIYDASGSTVLNATYMNKFNATYFGLNYTFNNTGNYLVENTYYLNGFAVAKITEDWVVINSTWQELKMFSIIVVLIGFIVYLIYLGKDFMKKELPKDSKKDETVGKYLLRNAGPQIIGGLFFIAASIIVPILFALLVMFSAGQPWESLMRNLFWVVLMTVFVFCGIYITLMFLFIWKKKTLYVMNTLSHRTRN